MKTLRRDTTDGSVRGHTPTVQTKSKTSGVRGHEVPSAKVVVIGAGLAGLCAAIEAAEAGAIVILLEKQKSVGGNSAKATSGINGVKTMTQVDQGVEDRFDIFHDDTMRSGGGLSEDPLVDTLVAYSRDAVEWLREGFDLDLTQICQCGGHSRPRTHRMPPAQDGRPVPVGWTMVSALKQRLEGMSNASILPGSRVIRLMTEEFDGEVGVLGVEYERGGVKNRMVADAVVLTTGGYAFKRGDGSLLNEFAQDKLTLPTTSGPQADGAGITLARKDVGAHLLHMDQVQVHPTGLVDPADPDATSKMLAPEAMRGSGGIMLTTTSTNDATGTGKGVQGHGRAGNVHRFCNELGTRAYVTERMLQKCGPDMGSKSCVAFLVMNEEASTAFGAPSLAFYKHKGVVRSATGAGELATLIGCEEEKLKETLETYGCACHKSEMESRDGEEPVTDEFGKVVFPAKDWRVDQEFHLAAVTPCIHYTMGGVAISSSTEVLRLRESGVYASVLGLFAAGEVTGGVHGANRLAGNSLLECVVFGRIAGKRAAQITQDVLPALDPQYHTPLRLRHKKLVSGPGHLYELSFELPSSRHTVFPWMLAGQYIAVRSEVEGEVVERFYSPITRDNYYGKVDLLVKAAPDGGAMQKFLHDMKPGMKMDMRGPMGGLDFEVDDENIDKVGMIAGGVGISPMVQIIRQALHEKLSTKMHLMWGVEFEEDLVYREVMEVQANLHEQLKTTYVVNQPSDSWQGERGFISQDVVSRRMFPPGKGVKVVVCGPWKMCQAMKKLLKDMKYTDEMIFSYM